MSRRALWRTAAVVLALCAIASLRGCSGGGRRRAIRAAAGCPAPRDSALMAAVARDTIARLRGRPQYLRRLERTPTGVEVRTEDPDSLSIHDGGLVSFDCAGRVTAVWLDGG